MVKLVIGKLKCQVVVINSLLIKLCLSSYKEQQLVCSLELNLRNKNVKCHVDFAMVFLLFLQHSNVNSIVLHMSK